MTETIDWWMSSRAMTIVVTTDKDLTIIAGAPIIRRRFIGQHLTNLTRWMRAQGGLIVERL